MREAFLMMKHPKGLLFIHLDKAKNELVTFTLPLHEIRTFEAMNRVHTLIILCLGVLILSSSCEGFFGTKTDPSFIDEPQFDDNTVAYVPIQPVLDGFVRPVDVIAGWDELIYVADGGTEEIVALDQAGNEQGRFRIQGLKAIVQDRRLDIIALGTRDTVIGGATFTLPAIYRLDLNKRGDYGIANASITNIITHPFYFKNTTPSGGDEAAAFTGVGIVHDNRYYVTRTGPSNSPSRFGGPDDAVLIFNSDDSFLSTVSVNTPLGIFNNYFKAPSGIATLAQPPQTPAVSTRGDFYYASLGEGNVLKVQRIRFAESDFGASFVVDNLPAGDTTKADNFLYTPSRFEKPQDVTVAGDGTSYIFVVDSERDSLYQFSTLGYEGVNPPAGSRSNKAIYASFGGTGVGLTQFNEPSGVAYLDRIVYVADAGNGRILRFKLTTDFE
ncbi:MAG: hypothetical protein AB8F95_14730 [Bacteroidia bacterium]